MRNTPESLTDPTGLDFALRCVDESMTCHNGHQGTYPVNDDGTRGDFKETIIRSDNNGGLVDQNGNRYNATVSGGGVSFSQVGSKQPGSMGEFINGSDPTKLQASNLPGFSFTFTYSNWAGNVSAGGTFTYKGTFQ